MNMGCCVSRKQSKLRYNVVCVSHYRHERFGVPEAGRQRVCEAAGDRRGHGLSPQRLVMGQLEIERPIPRAHGGGGEESNLWPSCSLCNRYKGTQVEPAASSFTSPPNPEVPAAVHHAHEVKHPVEVALIAD